MPTQDQLVPVSMGGGLDTKTDSKLVIPGKWSRLENCMLKGGKPQKRPGTTTLSALIDTGGSFGAGNGEALFAFGNELCRMNNGKLYGLSSALGKWVTKPGGGHFATIANQRIQRNTRSQRRFDQANSGSVSVFAWIEATAPQQGLHVAVLDDVTGTFYQAGNAAIGGTSAAVDVRVVAVGTKVMLVWADSAGNLLCSSVDPSAPETAPTAAVTLRTDAQIVTLPPFDAVAVGSSLVVAYGLAAATINLLQVSTAGAITLGPTPIATAHAVSGVCIGKDSSNVLYVLWSDVTAVTTTFATFNGTTFATVTAAAVVASAPSFNTASMVESSVGRMTVFLSVATSNGTIASFVLSSSAVTTAYALISGAYSLTAITDAFMFDGTAAVGVILNSRGSPSSTIQPTGWVLDVNGAMVAKVMPGACQGVGGGRAHATSVSGSTCLLFPEQGRLAFTSLGANNIINTSPSGITRVALTAARANVLPVNQLGDSVYVGGAFPMAYDGQQLAEAGFSLPSEGLSVSFGAGGSLSPGSYQWKAVYSWIDARGQLVRSPPSPAVTGSPVINQLATLTVPTLPLSTRDALPVGRQVQIEIYRTVANGTTFYRASSVTSPSLNSQISNTVSITDGISDAALQVGELLYTTGNIYDWLAPPAYQFACVHKGRLIIAGLEDPYEWRASSKSVKGEALRFNEAWGGHIPSSNGPITGLSSLDDKLIIFTASTFYVILGDGPDLLGNNPFSDPISVVGADTGCSNAQSIIESPDGVLFRGAKGICLLDRSLQTSYFGADVEAIASATVATIRSVTLVPQLEQVRFLLDTGNDALGTCLVYDYHYRDWASWTNYAGQDACLYQGLFTRVRSTDGGVIQESATAFTDSGAQYAWIAETAWLKFAGLQGFQRVKRALLVGDFYASASLLWEVAYDYAGAPAAPTYNAADSLTVSGSNYSAGGPFQAERLLRVQKCEALKFRFTEQSASGTGQGLSLADMSLLVGLKSGRFRGLPQSKRIG